MTMIRVVVVDDEPMVCAHLRTILGSGGTIEVVAEAHDGAAGVEAVTLPAYVPTAQQAA